MSYISALYVACCDPIYEPTAEELEQQRRWAEEKREREKHTIFNRDQYNRLARIDSDGGKSKISDPCN